MSDNGLLLTVYCLLITSGRLKMDKHWMVFRETKRQTLGEDFSGRISPPTPYRSENPARQWRERIVKGLAQFTGPFDTTPDLSDIQVVEDLTGL